MKISKLVLVLAALLSCALAMAPGASAAPTPPSNCMIVPDALVSGNVGALNTWFVLTSGCSTSKKPVQFRVVDGRIPPGTRLFTQGVSSGGITGVPTTLGVFTFTLQVRDATGTRETETFTITIEPPLPLVITNVSDALSPGTVGELYCCANLFASGGVPDYIWSLVSGELPPGLELDNSPRSHHGNADHGRELHLHRPGDRFHGRVRRANVLDDGEGGRYLIWTKPALRARKGR